MTIDHYAGAGRGWAAGAELVYAPIAARLVALSPHSLEGHRVLDAGAGTGAASEALAARSARQIASDLSADMLVQNADRRPPCTVADIRALPFRDRSFDDVVAAFVLNHLTEPAAGFHELIRVTRPGGALLATVYSTSTHSTARDRVDQVARAAGWQPPSWYLELKTGAVTLLGTAAAMAGAARAAGLTDVLVIEEPCDVGVTTPEQLVNYRFGQAPFAAWLASLDPARGADVRRRAAEAVRPIMEPYRPVVVFLRAEIPAT